MNKSQQKAEAILRHGFVVPESPAAGAARLRLLAHHVRRIEAQLRDVDRASRHSVLGEYTAWRDRATRAHKTLKSEQDQLTQWLREQETAMLRRAHAIVKTLDHEDLDHGEVVLVEWVDAYLAELENKPCERSTIPGAAAPAPAFSKE